MVQRRTLVLIGSLATMALAGCIGTDGAPSPAPTEAPGDAAVLLPTSVVVDGAQEIERTVDRAVFLWAETLPMSFVQPPDLSTSTVEVRTPFKFAEGVGLRVNAVLTWTNDADLSVKLAAHDGTVACADFGPGVNGMTMPVVEGAVRSRTCTARFQPATGAADHGMVVVMADHNLDDTPFEVVVTIEAEPADAIHDLAEIIPYEVAADDGTSLRGHVYVPTGDGPFATILNFNPYDNMVGLTGSDDRAREVGGRPTMVSPYGKFMDAGYAVAFVNLRGTGISDGCPAWFDASIDGPDAHAVVDAIAAEPWSDGSVGMVGISWHGYSQYAALHDRPEALKAVAPASAILDAWNLWTRWGAPINTQFGPMASSFGVFYAVTSTGPGDEPRHTDCPGSAAHLENFNALTLEGDKTSYFKARDNHAFIGRSDVPMLVSNGMTKLGEGHIKQIDGLWPLMNDQSRLLIGQWGHAYPPSTPTGTPYWDEVLAFMDHHVRGLGEPPESGVVDYQDRDGVWRQSDQWPPAATTTRLYLSDGALVDDPSRVTASAQAFKSTGVDPLPDDCVGSKAVYVSAPLAQSVVLAGNFATNFTLTSTLPAGNVGAFLWRLPELALCGLADVAKVDLDPPWEASRALGDLRHRGHLELGHAFPVGEPDTMSMTSHPFATAVAKGQRLVVAINGGSIELAQERPKPEYVVTTGPDIEAWIDIPVIEGQLRFQ